MNQDARSILYEAIAQAITSGYFIGKRFVENHPREAGKLSNFGFGNHWSREAENQAKFILNNAMQRLYDSKFLTPPCDLPLDSDKPPETGD